MSSPLFNISLQRQPQPVAQVPAFSVSPVVAAGVVGVLGYLLGGTRGAAIGALLGGGGAYFLAQQQAQPAPHGSPITGGVIDTPWGTVTGQVNPIETGAASGWNPNDPNTWKFN